MSNKHFFPCECGCSMIGMEIHEDEIELAFWSLGQPDDRRTSWKNKWSYIKQILINGHPYCDMVILDEQNAQQLVIALQKAIGEMKGEKE